MRTIFNYFYIYKIAQTIVILLISGCTFFNTESPSDELYESYRMHSKRIIRQHKGLERAKQLSDSLRNVALEPIKEELEYIDTILEQKLYKRYGYKKELYAISIYKDRVEIRDNSEALEVWELLINRKCESPIGSRCLNIEQDGSAASLILFGDIDSIDVIQDLSHVRYFP